MTDSESDSNGRMDGQAVLVHFGSGLESLVALLDLEDAVEARLLESGVGELDGHEVADDLSEGVLTMFGPDADALFAVVRPLLDVAPFLRGAVATINYGPPDGHTPSHEVTLGG